VYHAADGAIDKMDEELRQFASPDSVDTRSEKKEVALVLAAQNGQFEAVKLLLNLKADVEKHGPRALEVALKREESVSTLMQGRLHNTVKELLKAGAMVPTSGDLLLSFLDSGTIDKAVTTFKYAGMCLGPDNKIYCCPFDAPHVLVVDPVLKTLDRIDGVGEGQRKYFGICRGPDNKMYCAPHHANKVLVINPTPERGVTSKISFIEDHIFSKLEGQRKYAGIAMSDGKLYCSPRNSDNVLVIDPNAHDEKDKLAYIKVQLPEANTKHTGFKYSGIAKGPGADNKLYCAPQCALDVMVINPETMDLSFIKIEGVLGVERTEIFKYSDICLGPDDKLYCSPFGAHTVLVIDPKTQAFSTIGSVPDGGESQFSSICIGPGRKMYCSPENAPYVMIIHPDSQTLEFIAGDDIQKDKKNFLGICAGPEDAPSVFCAPFNSQHVMEIEPRPVLEIAEEKGGHALVEAFKAAEVGRQPGHGIQRQNTFGFARRAPRSSQ